MIAAYKSINCTCSGHEAQRPGHRLTCASLCTFLRMPGIAQGAQGRKALSKTARGVLSTNDSHVTRMHPRYQALLGDPGPKGNLLGCAGERRGLPAVPPVTRQTGSKLVGLPVHCPSYHVALQDGHVVLFPGGELRPGMSPLGFQELA
eukprot:CAMPEP_0206045038 /NCGR_PEP_ID=MMETSP1466-20131121/14769_1 /ASSEMBLY_ACC=CAM_ASM_001126 /TAXON_ID=44452 /ORGANISM="Pavlova gyrans, Strain CCMP608" /LENGTH=147 /DNA_ID=CAMNT_0053419959 /DNA_START=19 /DNA_END=463 /DNA_ORIENTATION=+